LHLVYEKQYPPKGHLYLCDMNKPEAKCPELTAQTASVLDNNILQQLFVSTQQNNLELCIEYAVKRYIVPKVKKEQNIISTMKRKLSGNQWAQEDLQEAGWGILKWFPHWQSFDSDVRNSDSLNVRRDVRSVLDVFLRDLDLFFEDDLEQIS